MKVNSIQYETFGGNVTHVAANKGYQILVGGERYLVGATQETSSAKIGAIDAIMDTFKRITAPKKQEPGVNVFA